MTMPEATFKQHLLGLKNYLKPVAAIFLGVFIAGFYLSKGLIQQVKGISGVEIIAIHPYEIFAIQVKLGFYAAAIVSLPLLVFQAFRFFRPAMTDQEYRMFRRYIPFMFILTIIGGSTGFIFLTEMTTEFLRGLAQGTGVVNNWTITNVISYMAKLSFSAAIIFNIPLAVMAGVQSGLIELEQLKQYRRHVLVASVAGAAIISPPDLFSMMFLSLPTYGFYELGVKAAAFV